MIKPFEYTYKKHVCIFTTLVSMSFLRTGHNYLQPRCPAHIF